LNLSEIQKLLRADVLTGDLDDNLEVKVAKASDLMSDVLTFSCSGALLITGLTNSQSIRTAQVADLCAIVFVRGKRPTADTIQLAKDGKIPLLATGFSMYEACGILFSNGLTGLKD
jgi:predicted transcriptional regulator